MADKTKAFVAGMFLEIGGAGSPTVYARICEANAISGIGKTNALVDSTTFCSGGVKEFIPGLAEGSEITIDANYIISSAVRRQLMDAVNDRATVELRLVVDQEDDGILDEEYRFAAAAISYSISPSTSDKNTAHFSLKISGEINYMDHYLGP